MLGCEPKENFARQRRVESGLRQEAVRRGKWEKNIAQAHQVRWKRTRSRMFLSLSSPCSLLIRTPRSAFWVTLRRSVCAVQRGFCSSFAANSGPHGRERTTLSVSPARSPKTWNIEKLRVLDISHASRSIVPCKWPFSNDLRGLASLQGGAGNTPTFGTPWWFAHAACRLPPSFVQAQPALSLSNGDSLPAQPS